MCCSWKGYFPQTTQPYNYIIFAVKCQCFLKKKFKFHCADDKDAGLVVRSLPMLPVTDVLEYFEIPFNKITVSDAKASVTVDFSAE